MTRHGKASERRASEPASDAEGSPIAQRQELNISRENPAGASASNVTGTPVVGPERDIISKIEGFINDFEKGKIGKTAASTSIAVAITSESHG
ncbi:hypothetical protein H0H92_011024 [Tricholoma furcatifolium]|nr:hypothetical protein H0H92_012415 [Tricholoma furcatifolium]KAG6823224.1 hypothetical protein H0H92_011024 [Tricholoma furcatifolium]